MPVLVVGSGRSGTSAVARVLHERLGVDMGGPGKFRESNPDGDYEDTTLVQIDDAFADGQIDTGEFRARLAEATAHRREPWGFKHPRACTFLQHHLAVWPDAVVVWAWRDRDDTAASFSRWYGRPVSSCVNTVKRRNRALAALLSSRDHLLIDMTERRSDEEIERLLRPHVVREAL